jgi:uncharacterized damage-inducible protein DinB
MFSTPQEAIAFGLKTSKLMFHRFIDDLNAEEFNHRPCLGANSAAWIVGHLTSTDRSLLERIGVRELPEVPQGFPDRFATTKAAATGTQADFGPPNDLVRLFDQHRDLLIEQIKKTPLERLTERPNMQTPLFSDRGESLLFMALHTAMHLGQLSTIRRSLGRPPVA